MRTLPACDGRATVGPNGPRSLDYAFVMHMSKLGSRASPEVLPEMAEGYHRTHFYADPAKTAQWRVDEMVMFHDE